MTRLRLLISFAYFGQTRATPQTLMEQVAIGTDLPDVFLDSGAFSALTQGTRLDLGEYADWITRWQGYSSTYANLDVIDDPAATDRNQADLERRGLHPIPVFHTSTDFTRLERMLDAGYKYIALGGMVRFSGGRKQELARWIVECFRRCEGRAVLHAFGLTNWNVIRSYPWYSVDSTSWVRGHKYGGLLIFDEREGAMVHAYVGNHKSVYAKAPQIRALGHDPALFADRARYNWRYAFALCFDSMIAAERYARRMHGEIERADRDTEPGLRLYLANTGWTIYVEMARRLREKAGLAA